MRIEKGSSDLFLNIFSYIICTIIYIYIHNFSNFKCEFEYLACVEQAK